MYFMVLTSNFQLCFVHLTDLRECEGDDSQLYDIVKKTVSADEAGWQLMRGKSKQLMERKINERKSMNR